MPLTDRFAQMVLYLEKDASLGEDILTKICPGKGEQEVEQISLVVGAVVGEKGRGKKEKREKEEKKNN